MTLERNITLHPLRFGQRLAPRPYLRPQTQLLSLWYRFGDLSLEFMNFICDSTTKKMFYIRKRIVLSLMDTLSDKQLS